MTALEALAEATSLANLGALPEGPKGQLEAIGLAQAYALISIARSLEALNDKLESVTGEIDESRSVIRTFSHTRRED